MDGEQRRKLLKLNINFEEVLERFADNEDLYIKCLHKFVAKNSYGDLVKAMDEGNVEDAFEAAHSLKGVTGNLGFERLFEDSKEITEIFRAGSMDVSPEAVIELNNAYDEVIDVINSL